MALALSLLLDAEASHAVRQVWSALAEAGISSDMRDLGYPPHLTLLAADDETLADRLAACLPALTAIVPARALLGGVRQFVDSPVVWIECLGEFNALHEAAAGLVSPDGIRPHYRPGAWTPHVTLQTVGDAARAKEEAHANWHPRTTGFARLEIVTFPPAAPLAGIDIGPIGSAAPRP